MNTKLQKTHALYDTLIDLEQKYFLISDKRNLAEMNDDADKATELRGQALELREEIQEINMALNKLI
jgi:hypothetical protein